MNKFVSKVIGLFKPKVSKKDIERNIKELEEERKKLQKGTEEYGIIQTEINKELDNYKKLIECRNRIKPGTVTATMAVLLFGFGIALDRESPKSLKLAQYLSKLLTIVK